MLDNLGFGEFFALALMALLFFGPERLPQIGAKLGQWVRKLTGYSRAFMTEWSEEALVIRDAVKEVKGLRDEIIAAQAEIASTMDTTRTDVNEALDGAKLDVRQQVAGVAGAVAPDNRGDLPAKSPSEYRGSTTSTSRQLAETPAIRSADLTRLRDEVGRIQEEMAALREAVARFRDDVVPADVANEDEDTPAEIAPVVVEIAGEMR